MQETEKQDRPFLITVPGYPRVGSGRTYKTLLEGFWNGKLTEQQFHEGITQLKAEQLKTQEAKGLDLIPCGNFSLYDQVLDSAIQFGCIPERFGWDGGDIGHSLYFAMARGSDGIPPLEMTKWFDTNYHYLVPELPATFQLTSNRALEEFEFAKSIVGLKAKPVLIGPFTFLKLSRLSDGELAARMKELVPFYKQILLELTAAGAGIVQIDESCLVADISLSEAQSFQEAYEELGSSAKVVIQTYYGDVAAHYDMLCKLPVAGLGLDLVRGKEANLHALRNGFPADKTLVAGVVDGRNIWRADLDQVLATCQELAITVRPTYLILSSSCPLLHLPETVSSEINLPATLRNALSFAQERLTELRLLADALIAGDSHSAYWQSMRAALFAWNSDKARFDDKVQQRVKGLTSEQTTRVSFSERSPLQAQRLKLPLLPTTTIGSFPQTSELRKARARRKSDPSAYEAAIRNEIAEVVKVQEEIGLDVLVHGEPERNDMVQFFGDQMKGFATTEEGWVQSYGSRCVRPPIIYGDLDRIAPMTVQELRYAMSLTSKPMKGMLTGPITILQWSFVREDISRAEVAYQIAFAIRDEIADLEAIGLPIIQIDEAAFREGLPLRRSDREAYIAWAVQAFKIATSGAKPETQIHTHMCYSEFGDMIEAIAAMDADVISIEDSRSGGALLETLRDFQYPNQIGPGVYDIHSPNIPTVEFIEERLQSTLKYLRPNQVWVNPDCGLKTRGYAEVVPALQNMMEAAKKVRERLASTNG